MNVIVTGSSGFLGGKIAEKLEVYGYKTILLNRKSSDQPNSYKVDIVRQQSVQHFIKNFSDEVSYLIHCAAVTPWAENTDFSLDLAMARNIIRLCNSLKIKTLVFLSGWIVYDIKQKPPYTEGTPKNPANDYGRSKLAVEQYFKNNLDLTKLINLRLASVYGPGQTSAGLIPNLVKSALKNGKITINSKNTKRDYLYIDDFVMAVSNLLSQSINDNIDLNLGSGSSVSVLKVAQSVKLAIKELCQQEVGINLSSHLNESEPLDNQLSIEKAKAMNILPGTTPFAKGIKQYVKWVVHENSI